MNAIVEYDREQVELVKRTVAKGATDDELQMFLHQCRRMGLDPLAKQLIFQKYNTKDGPKVSFITTVDACRVIADRSGAYAGNDEPVFMEGENGVPVRASVTVWKIVAGKRVPFTATVYWAEYCPEPPRDKMWRKMPHVMLGKCAEVAALRKAFPNDLSGAYIREEMDQAGDVIGVVPRAPEFEGVPEFIEGYEEPPDRVEVKLIPREAVPAPASPRPYAPDVLRTRITEIAGVMNKEGKKPTEGQKKMLPVNMEQLFLGQSDPAGMRHKLLEYLCGVRSTKELSDGEVLALVKWMDYRKTDDGDWLPAHDAITEALAAVSAAEVSE